MWMMRSPVGRLLWVLPEALMLMAAVLLMGGCAPLQPPPSPGGSLGYTPQGEAETVTGESSSSRSALRQAQARHRRREFSDEVTSVLPRHAAEPAGQSASLTREAVLSAVNEVMGTQGLIADALPRLASKPGGLGDRANGVFTRYIDYGSSQLPWLHGALGDVSLLAGVASEMDDADM